MDEFIEQIPPINAQYLLESEPYHVYADAHGSVNEVLIQRVWGSVNGIIAEYFHDGSSWGWWSSSSLVLISPGWRLVSLHNPEKYVAINFEMFRRLLNPTDWSGWQYQRRYTKERWIPENYLRKTYPKTRWPISVHALVAEKVARIQARL